MKNFSDQSTNRPGARRTAGPTTTSGQEASLGALIESARTAVGAIHELDLDGLPAGRLTAAIRAFGRVERAASAVRARLVAAAANAAADSHAGATSMASLLQHELGLSGRQARRQARLAEDLRRVPGAAGALARGQIGTEQAAIIGQAARDGRLGTGPDTEAALLADAARLTPEQLRRVRARREADADPDALAAAEAAAIRDRRVHFRKRGHSWSLEAQLDPVRGATIEAMLVRLATWDPPDTPEDERRTSGQRMADALVRMAELADDHADTPDGRTVRPATATVIIDWNTLRELAEQGGHQLTPAGELDGHGPITGQLARRILCDAQITRLIAGPNSMPLDVGRATPKWSPAQRRAVVARDGGCRGPHCDRPATWCQIHHIDWWTRDLGHTNVANGLLLCRHHHDLIHHGRWKLTVDPTTHDATWTSRSGHTVVTTPTGPMTTPTGNRPRQHRQPDRPNQPDHPSGTQTRLHTVP